MLATIQNSISPVLTATGLFSAFTGMEDTAENQKKFLANIPMGRLGSPGDVANAALFYAAEDSKFLTGKDSLRGKEAVSDSSLRRHGSPSGRWTTNLRQ